MCIIHKGFRGFQALSPASILGGNLIGLKDAIPYDFIPPTGVCIKTEISSITKHINYEKNKAISDSCTRINDIFM